MLSKFSTAAILSLGLLPLAFICAAGQVGHPAFNGETGSMVVTGLDIARGFFYTAQANIQERSISDGRPVSGESEPAMNWGGSEVKESSPETVEKVLSEGEILAARWWTNYIDEEATKTYLCIVFADPNFPDSLSRIEGELPSNTRDSLRLYELIGNSLFLRYMYSGAFVSLDEFLRTPYSKGDGPNNIVCSFVAGEATANRLYFALGIRAGKVRCIWQTVGWDQPEYASIDNDHISEIIVVSSGRFVYGIEPPLAARQVVGTPSWAMVYKYIEGRFECVEIVPWDERLELRELPDVALKRRR